MILTIKDHRVVTVKERGKVVYAYVKKNGYSSKEMKETSLNEL